MDKSQFPMEYDDPDETIGNLTQVDQFRKAVYEQNSTMKKAMARTIIETMYGQCKCSLSLEIMKQPAFVSCCGKSFENEQIKMGREAGQKCPNCRTKNYTIIKSPDLYSVTEQVFLMRDIVNDYIRLIEVLEADGCKGDKMEIVAEGKNEEADDVMAVDKTGKDVLFTEDHISAVVDFMKGKRKRPQIGFSRLRLEASVGTSPVTSAPSIANLIPNAKDIEAEIIKSLTQSSVSPSTFISLLPKDPRPLPIPTLSNMITMDHNGTPVPFFQKATEGKVMIVLCVARSSSERGVEKMLKFLTAFAYKCNGMKISIMEMWIKDCPKDQRAWETHMFGRYDTMKDLAKGMGTITENLKKHSRIGGANCFMPFEMIVEKTLEFASKWDPESIVMLLPYHKDFTNFEGCQSPQLPFLLEAYKGTKPMHLDVISVAWDCDLASMLVRCDKDNFPFRETLSETTKYKSDNVRFWWGDKFKM